jgi:hypothetical protein
MKQAVGIDPQSALGAAIRELRAQGKGNLTDAKKAEYELSKADLDGDAPIELTKPKPKPST